MVKKNKFWTPTKVIVTILIAISLLFLLFKMEVFNFIDFNTFFVGGEPSPSMYSGLPGASGVR